MNFHVPSMNGKGKLTKDAVDVVTCSNVLKLASQYDANGMCVKSKPLD